MQSPFNHDNSFMVCVLLGGLVRCALAMIDGILEILNWENIRGDIHGVKQGFFNLRKRKSCHEDVHMAHMNGWLSQLGDDWRVLSGLFLSLGYILLFCARKRLGGVRYCMNRCLRYPDIVYVGDENVIGAARTYV